MKRRNILLLFGIVVIVAAIAVVAAADREDNGTRAGETYVGSEACDSCRHGSTTNEYLNWSETAHGIDFANDWDYHGTPTNKYTYGSGNDTTGMTGSCAPCHVVGYNQPSGFDPALPWNSTDTTNNVGNILLLRIGCENCHGPGSAHEGSAQASDINLGLDRYAESCAGTDDAECHSGYRQWGNESIGGWSQSMHGPADDTAENEDRSLNRYCAECKDPSNFDATKTRDDTYDFSEFRGVTCGDCHDLHPDPANTNEYQLHWPVEDSCDACHNGGHHETMRTGSLAGEPSVNRTKYPYMEEVECVECHMWSSPRNLRGTEYEHVGHDFSATIDACLDCHTDIFDVVDDWPSSSSNPTGWQENLTAWEPEYAEEYEHWEHVVENAQERHEELLEEVTELVEEVEEIMEIAEGNGTWTDDMEHEWEQAEYDWELAEHNSMGAHNPAYGTALLHSAKEALEGILEELEMGTIKGKVTDESDAAMEGVMVYVNGNGVKTDSQGMYMVHVDPGTYTLSAFKKGNAEHTASGLVIVSAQVIEQNFTLAPDFDHDGTADATDTDDDNDGYPDASDDFPKDPQEWNDNDNDSIGDNEDDDDDNDGVKDDVDAAPLDSTIDTEIADIGKGDGEEEEADTTMYLVLIIVLIVIVVLLLVMYMKKGSGSSSPPPEPEPEPPMEEEVEEEEA